MKVRNHAAPLAGRVAKTFSDTSLSDTRSLKRVDTFMQAMKGFTIVAGNLQNLKESKRGKRLNIPVLLLIPLDYELNFRRAG